MGHRLTANGVSPDPAKVKAIVEMPKLEDRKGVERLLGCITYLARFLPTLAEIVGPLRPQTEKDAMFVWQKDQDTAFKTVKELVATAPVLRYYESVKQSPYSVMHLRRGLGLPCYSKDNQLLLHPGACQRQNNNMHR